MVACCDAAIAAATDAAGAAVAMDVGGGTEVYAPDAVEPVGNGEGAGWRPELAPLAGAALALAAPLPPAPPPPPDTNPGMGDATGLGADEIDDERDM